MYTRLNQQRTKKHYRQILSETLRQTQSLRSQLPDLRIYQSIENQLLDIQKNMIDKGLRLSEDEIYTRYDLGALAVKNFDLQNEEYAQRLSDVFGGTFDYHELPEDK